MGAVSQPKKENMVSRILNKFIALNGILILGLIWVSITAGLLVAGQTDGLNSIAIWELAVHIPYLGYPILVSIALSSLRASILSLACASAWLVCMPWVTYVQSNAELSDGHIFATAAVSIGWFYILIRGARLLVAAEGKNGLALTVLLFVVLPWGGVVLLHRRLQKIVLSRAPA